MLVVANVRTTRHAPYPSSNLYSNMNRFSTIHYDARLARRDQVVAYLSRQPLGTAHPWFEADTGRRVLLIQRDARVEEEPLHDTDLRRFLDAAALSSLSDLVTAQLDKYSQLASIRQFELQVLRAGEHVTVPLRREKMLIVATSKGANGFNEFFDLCVYTAERTACTCLTYNQREMHGLRHSGDVGGLLHYVEGFDGCARDRELVFTVVGYNKNALRKFVAQQPAVMIVDYERHIVYVVPCPLDEASVRNDTLAHLVVARVDGPALQCQVLQRPVTVAHVNTGDRSEAVAASVHDARLAADALRRATDAAAGAASAAASAAASPAVAMAPPVHCVVDGTGCVYVEHGAQVPAPLSALRARRIHWSVGFDDDGGSAAAAPLTVLPHIFGIVDGPAAAVGVPPRTAVPPPDWPCVVVCTEEMSDVNARMAQTTANCIMIIVKRAPPKSSVTPDHEVLLNEVNVNAAAAMAGPNAIVLVSIGDRLLWYRGVRVPQLVARVPCYGDDVTDLFGVDRLAAWLDEPLRQRVAWPMVHIKQDRHVYFEARMTSVDEAVARLETYGMAQLQEHMDDLLDLFTQMSVVLETADMKPLVARIDAHLVKAMGVAIEPCKQALLEAYGSGNTTEVRQWAASLRAEKRALSKSIGRLSSALENLDSVRGVSRKTQSIARRARATAIAANVERAKNMSLRDKICLFEQYCDSMLVLAVEPEPLAHYLAATGANRLCEAVAARTAQYSAFAQDPRVPFLDPDTYGSLLELTQNEQHALSGAECIAIPQGHDPVARRKPSFALPLVRRIIELRDPASLRWAEEANKEEFSLYRILLRGMIATATASRAFNISASSNDLGFLLVHGVLCALESVASHMRGSAPTWHDTTCEAMRGLFGQLLTLMASTNKTLCSAYTLVYPNVKMPTLHANEWWALERMVRVFPYTCWDTSVLYTNVRRFLVQTVHRQITGPPSEALCRAASAARSVQNVLPQEWRDYVRVVVDVVFRVCATGAELQPAMAARLLSLSDTIPRLSRGTHMMNDVAVKVRDLNETLRTIAEGTGDDNAGEWTDACVNLVRIALFSYVKHSGNVADTDKQAVRARIHASTASVNEYVRIYRDVEQSPWTKSNAADNEQNVAFVLGQEVGSMDNTLLALVAAQSAPPPPTTLAEELALLAGSSRAVAVAEQVHEMTIESTALPREFGALMVLTGIDQHNVTATFRDVIVAMLREWRHVDDALAAGLGVLEAVASRDTDHVGGGSASGSIEM